MTITRRQFELASLATLLAAETSTAQQPAAPPPVFKEVPWLAEVQTPPPALPPDTPRLPPLTIDVFQRPILTLSAWHKHREDLRREWLRLLGSWEKPRRAPQIEVVESERSAGISRQLIHYESESGFPVEAYLLKPADAKGRLPGVVVLHSTVDYTIRQGAGLEGAPEAAWGLKLAQRGFVAICPRCFLWTGEPMPNYQQRVQQHHSRHRDATGMAKMLFDAERAVDVLVSQPEVDPRRIGAAGHSLGAKEALYLAAFDERIKAAVSSEGGVGTQFSNWDAPWYLGTKQWSREHHELVALAAPRAFLLIGGNSADGARSWPFVASAIDVYRLYGRVPRVGLYNHGQGHTIPPQAETRVYEWLQAYV